MYLVFVETADVLRRHLEGHTEVLLHLLPGGGDLLLRDLQRIQLHAVKALRVFLQGLVAPFTDSDNDLVHSFGNVFFRLDIPVQDLLRRNFIKFINGDHAITSVSFARSVSISAPLNW